MASQQNILGNEPAIRERLTKVETQVEGILQRFATKADLERQTRLLVMWMIATQLALAAFLYSVLR